MARMYNSNAVYAMNAMLNDIDTIEKFEEDVKRPTPTGWDMKASDIIHKHVRAMKDELENLFEETSKEVFPW